MLSSALDAPGNAPTRRRHALPAFLLMALVSGSSVLVAGESTPPARQRVVRLTIDYGDGVQKHFKAIDWRPGMTVQQLLDAASKHPRGIRYEFRGKGATALLTRIDDLGNEGGGERNWIYRVNDKPGERSFGIATLENGDTVLWSFETYR